MISNGKASDSMTATVATPHISPSAPDASVVVATIFPISPEGSTQQVFIWESSLPTLDGCRFWPARKEQLLRHLASDLKVGTNSRLLMAWKSKPRQLAFWSLWTYESSLHPGMRPAWKLDLHMLCKFCTCVFCKVCYVIQIKKYIYIMNIYI